MDLEMELILVDCLIAEIRPCCVGVTRIDIEPINGFTEGRNIRSEGFSINPLSIIAYGASIRFVGWVREIVGRAMLENLETCNRP